MPEECVGDAKKGFGMVQYEEYKMRERERIETTQHVKREREGEW